MLFVVLTKPRMAAIEQVLATENRSVSPTFLDLVNHPIPWISIQTRATIVLGIIYLKIAKPDLGGSLLIIGIAIVLGLVSVLLIPRHVHAQKGPVD